MARTPKSETVETVTEEHAAGTRSLAAVLSKKSVFSQFSCWLVGDTPLIVHAWSQKAKLEMLGKQVKAVRSSKEARDPHADYVSSLYPMGPDTYGFPVTGIKNCILSAAHKDKGVPRSTAMGALWLHSEMVRVMPALAGACCDMPLVKIFGDEPEMREDMTKIGAGLSKVANLAYRAQFKTWAIKITGSLNSAVLTEEQLAFLIEESGRSSGLGEWRNERKGVFGAFHLASIEEELAWQDFADGRGPIPRPEMLQAAE